MPEFEPIELGGCRIAPFSDVHMSERYIGWLNDPEVVRYSEQRHSRHDRASCEAYRRGTQAAGNLFLAIEAPGLGHIGNISVSVDLPNGSADVSIMIGEAQARGKGLATLAFRATVEWLLGPGGLRRVTAGTMEANKPMIALMRKSGMAIESVRPRAFLLDGEEVGCVLAARFADGKSDLK